MMDTVTDTLPLEPKHIQVFQVYCNRAIAKESFLPYRDLQVIGKLGLDVLRSFERCAARLDQVEAELERLKRENKRLRELVTEGTATGLITVIPDWGDDAGCHFCSHRWPYTDHLARQNIATEKEAHFDDCWVVRARAALAAATDEQEGQG